MLDLHLDSLAPAVQPDAAFGFNSGAWSRPSAAQNRISAPGDFVTGIPASDCGNYELIEAAVEPRLNRGLTTVELLAGGSNGEVCRKVGENVDDLIIERAGGTIHIRRCFVKLAA